MVSIASIISISCYCTSSASGRILFYKRETKIAPRLHTKNEHYTHLQRPPPLSPCANHSNVVARLARVDLSYKNQH